jgi:predicted DNA binding protein
MPSRAEGRAMVTAAITIPLREEFGLTAVSLRYPTAAFSYLAGIEEPAPDGGRGNGRGLVEVRSADLDDVLREIEAVDAVRAFELLDRDGDRAVFQYETDVAALYRAVLEADIVPAFPYAVRNGTLLFTATTTPDRLSRLGDVLRSRGIPFEVTAVTRRFDGGDPDPLTDRQRTLVLAAVDAGYYDTPRRCTLAELAASLGIASSTASETLHRAEGRLVERYAERVAPAPRGRGVS